MVSGGRLDAVRVSSSSAAIVESEIHGAVEAGISLVGGGALGPSLIETSVISGCGVGLAARDGAQVDGQHATVSDCGTGLLLSPLTTGADGGHATLHSSILWGNGVWGTGADVVLGLRSSLDLTYSDVGDTAWPGAGNISEDPRFSRPVDGDFSLKFGSPCIDTGKDTSDMGAIPFTGGFIFLRGDVNGDTRFDISDAVSTLNYLFSGGTTISCLDVADADDSGSVDITDAIFSLRYLFTGGDEIPPPFPTPGPDPTQDVLECNG
jgi:hypothetical protein